MVWECTLREEMADIIKSARSRRENQDARLKSLRARYAKAKRDDLTTSSRKSLSWRMSLRMFPPRTNMDSGLYGRNIGRADEQ